MNRPAASGDLCVYLDASAEVVEGPPPNPGYAHAGPPLVVETPQGCGVCVPIGDSHTLDVAATGDAWVSLRRDVLRHAPLRLANLTAERDAANALTTLVALLNLGPTATWREVSAAVAEMLDKTPRSTGRWAERALCAEAWAVAAMDRVAALEAREAEACPLCYGSSRYVSDVDCDRCANTGAVMVKP